MKLKVLFSGFSILLIILIQTTLLDYVRVFGVKPNLIFVFVVSIALLRGNVEGAVTGFFAGLMQDIVSGKVIGFYALLGIYLGLIMGSVNKRLYRENIFVVIFFTFVSTIAYESVVFFLGVFLKGQWSFIYPFKGIIIPEAIYNAVISIFTYILVIKTDHWIERAGRLPRRY
jgi:rod shape-determining protein MreD